MKQQLSLVFECRVSHMNEGTKKYYFLNIPAKVFSEVEKTFTDKEPISVYIELDKDKTMGFVGRIVKVHNRARNRRIFRIRIPFLHNEYVEKFFDGEIVIVTLDAYNDTVNR